MRDAFALAVEAAIDALPADQRAALIMKDGEGLSYAEIGERMSLSAEAARALYVQAMLALRRATDPRGRLSRRRLRRRHCLPHSPAARIVLVRDTLDHLPASKQRELAHAVRVLFEEFATALAGATQNWKRRGRILKLVLYGSHARGDWVDDPVGGYHSDYDILIVVNDEHLTDFELWSAAEDRLMRDVTINQALGAPVSFIVHSLDDVNGQLERGRPFFVDIVDQGYALYEAEGYPFAQPRLLPPADAKVEAQKHFDAWFDSAAAFYQNANDNVARSRPKEAAFLFHQATERLYHCTLLVLTLYSPKSHRLNFLRSQAEQVAPRLVAAWPRDNRFARRCFELLRQAYVNARYSPHYEISDEELRWLEERVELLKSLVEDVCREHIDALGRDVAA